MATSISSSCCTLFSSLPSINNKPSSCVVQNPNNHNYNFIKLKLTPKFPRLGISYAKTKGFKHVVSCLVNDDLNGYAEREGSSGSIESTNEATIDLKLPRRSLLVQFTCDACGVRSQRLINRLAYEKGLVYVQCSGCSLYHKLVDNLDLVVEYDFRDEINTSLDTDQA